jgi:hypothetical protein
MKMTTSPGAAGTIVDAAGKPLGGVEVLVSNAAYTPPPSVAGSSGRGDGPVTAEELIPPSMGELNARARSPRVITDASGRFSIPPVRRWILYVVPMEISPAEGTLLIRRAGFPDRILRLSSKERMELGNVMVE